MISSVLGVLDKTMDHCSVLDTRYRLLMTLGEGRHARVKLVWDDERQEHFAVKMVHPSFTELQLKLIINEVAALTCLEKQGDYTSIIDFNFFGDVACPSGNSYKTAYYVMPLEEHGEFFHYIEHGKNFSEKTARKLFQQLSNCNQNFDLLAVFQLHEQKLAHRDIKCENILLSADYRLKLCDFGSCVTMESVSLSRQHEYEGDELEVGCPLSAIGSPEYNPPEIQIAQMLEEEEEEDYKLQTLERQEVFSLGCVLFLMVANCMPFRCASMQDKSYRRLINNPNKYWRIVEKTGINFSDEFKGIIFDFYFDESALK